MDERLLGWGRAVKARRRSTLPSLWLFTDPARGEALDGAMLALPPGLCGVVFRHDGVPGRAALLRHVARRCRARRIALVVAGRNPGLAGVGTHLRGGRGVARGRLGLVTSSAHGVAELRRARLAGARVAFLSPCFPTASHEGARALGPVRWAAMARGAGLEVFALGGMTGQTARRLPRWAGGAGAIGALMG